MKYSSGLVWLGLLAGCVTRSPSTIPGNVEFKFLGGKTFVSSGIYLDAALTYKDPLKTPFGFHADIRCREKDGPYDVQPIIPFNVGTNIFPNEATKFLMEWVNRPVFDTEKEYACRVRIFSMEVQGSKPSEHEKAYDILALWCLKTEPASDAQELKFVMADAKLCQ
jgi:hypothetical protein